MREEVRCIGFNQDASCLAVGTTAGYRIFTLDPLTEWRRKEDGGMSIVCMFYRTSLLALVGAGCARQSPRQLQLHNTQTDSDICNISFADTVLSVKINRKRIVVILERCLHIFDVTRMSPLRIIDTDKNERGLGALSANEDHCTLAYPKAVAPAGGTPATPAGSGDVMVLDAMDGRTVHVVRAHSEPLAAVELSADGKMLATAGASGTDIYVHGVSLSEGKAELLHHFKRGVRAADVHALAFNARGTFLAVSSSSATVHVFHVAKGSYRSFAKIDVEKDSKPAVALDGNILHVATRDGRLRRFRVSPDSADGYSVEGAEQRFC